MKNKRAVQLFGLLMIVLTSSLLFLTDNPADTEGIVQPEALSISNFEDVNILENGNADVSLDIEVAGPALVEMYRSMLGAQDEVEVDEEMPIPENKTKNDMVLPVKQEFFSSLKKEQKSTLGFAMRILDSSMVPRNSEGNMQISIDAYMTPQVSVYPNGSDGIWEIFVGPKDEQSLTVAGEGVITEVTFAQKLLTSIEGEQVFDKTNSVNFSLPYGAQILNGDELAGLSWELEFGGGTYKRASLSLDGQSNLVLQERTVITEENTTVIPEELYDAFISYKIFTIKYLLPGHSVISGEDVWVSNDGDWRTPAINFAFERSFSLPLPSSFKGIDIDAELIITPSIGLGGGIQFEFDKYLRLSEFKAWISASADLNVRFRGTVSYGIEKIFPYNLYKATLLTLEVNVLFVPVIITLNLEIIAQIALKAEAYVSFDLEADVGYDFSVGYIWRRGSGWNDLNYARTWAVFNGGVPDSGLSCSIEPSLRFRISLLLYGDTGAYVEFQPYIRGQLDVHLYPAQFTDWSISAGWRLNIGLTFGDTLKKVGIDLPEPPPKTLYDEQIWEHWGRIGHAPSAISINIQPDSTYSGSAVTISGIVSSQYRGSKNGYIQIEYKPESSGDWISIGETYAPKEGHYSYWWATPELDAGAYLLRARFEENDAFLASTSNSLRLNLESYVTGLIWIQNHDGTNENTDFSSSVYPLGTAVKLTPPITPWYIDKVRMFGGYSVDGTLTIEIWDKNLNTLSHNEFLYSNYFPYIGENIENFGWSNDINIPDVVVGDEFYLVFSCSNNLLWLGVNDQGIILPDYEVDLNANTIISTNYGEERLISVGCYPLSALWIESYDFGKYETASSQTFIPTETFYITDYAMVIPITFNLQGMHSRFLEFYDPNGVLLFKFNETTASNWDGVDNLICPLSIFGLNNFREAIGEPFRIQLYMDNHLMVNQTFRVIEKPIFFLEFSAPDQATVGDTIHFEVPMSNYISPDTTGTFILHYTTQNPALVENTFWYDVPMHLEYPGWNPTIPVAVADWTVYKGGTLYFQAWWSGDSNFSSTNSAVKIIEVAEAESSLQTTLSENTIRLGSAVRITSQITPAIWPAGITFQYAYSPDASVWYYINQTSLIYSSNLGFHGNYTWTPPDVGVYYVRSRWLGDDQNNAYKGANSSAVQLTVLPSNYTQVEIFSGAHLELDRTPNTTTTLSVRVRDQTTAQLLQTIGRVDFYVTDYSNYTQILAGSDSDIDGDGIYQIQWTVADENWTTLGPQFWSAEFTGTTNYMPSIATTDLTIYYYGAAMWVDPTYKEIDVKQGGEYMINFEWNYYSELDDNFNLSLPGVDLSAYALSRNTVSASSYMSGQWDGKVALTLLPPNLTAPNVEDFAWLENPGDISITATAIDDQSFSLSATTTAAYGYTPDSPVTPLGGLSLAVRPKTINISNFNFRYTQLRVKNNQDFDDNITIQISLFGVPTDYQAQQEWFSFGYPSSNITEIDLYILAGADISFPLFIQLNESPMIENDVDTYVFLVTATSKTTDATAQDSGIINLLI